MENRTQTIREIISSNRKKRSSNELYSGHSPTENIPQEIGTSCKEVSFVVEWQMQNPMPEYFEEK